MTEMKTKKYQIAGGPVDRDQCIYVERPEDNKLYEYLIDDFGFVNLVGSRQVGKSSMVFGLKKQKGWQTVTIDFRSFEKTYYEPEEWFQSLFKAIAESLDHNPAKIIEWYENQKGTAHSKMVMQFVQSYIRGELGIKEPLLFIFDEIDLLMSHGYHTDDFFYGLFLLFDKRKELKVSMLTAGVTPPKFLFKNRMLSSFKTGVLMELKDFTPEDEILTQWAAGLKGADKTCQEIVKEVFKYTDGHPWLTVMVCDRFEQDKRTSATDVKQVVNEILKDQIDPFKRNFHFDNPKDFITAREAFAYRVLSAYRQILEKPHPLNIFEEVELAILKIAGLVKVVDDKLEVRNFIYRRVFDKEWIDWLEKGLGSKDWYEQTVIPEHLRRRNRPTICLINTGGTIGMVEREGKMVPPENEKEIKFIYPNISDIANVELLSINIKDSVNIFHEDWTEIARSIFDRRNDGYDGFVVAHGTDTLAYTASAVAFALGPGLNFPVVFVGSQAPSNIIHGDAHINLARACLMASQDIPEVVICYNDQVFRAVRAEKKDDYRFDGFHSPTYKPIATIAERIEFNREWHEEIRTRKKVKQRFELIADFDPNILQIVTYPGIQPDLFEKMIFGGDSDKSEKKISAVIIQSLGVGNLPSIDEFSFLPFIERLSMNRIPTVITSRYPIQPEFAKKYRPAAGPLDKGAISAGNMTTATAFTKLSWLLPQIERDIERGDVKPSKKLVELDKLLGHNYIGELDAVQEN